MTGQQIEKARAATEPRFTVATLVNDEPQYTEMLASFGEAGFTRHDTEFIAARRATSAFSALNEMLALAQGDMVILCHQDIRLVHDRRAQLDERLSELDRLDPAWAIAGNAGGEAAGRLALRITDPHGSDRKVGKLPSRVMSLDENFIVTRRKAGIRFSRDLEGFHLYGADLCLNADILGWSSWVIDFHLHHLSPGRKDHTFHHAEQRFREKWNRALRPRWMQTTCTLLHLSGAPGSGFLSPLVEPLIARITRRLPASSGWTARPRSQPR